MILNPGVDVSLGVSGETGFGCGVFFFGVEGGVLLFGSLLSTGAVEEFGTLAELSPGFLGVELLLFAPSKSFSGKRS